MIETKHHFLKKGNCWRVEAISGGEKLGGAYLSVTGKVLKLLYIMNTSDSPGVGSSLLEKIIDLARDLELTEVRGDFIPVPEKYASAKALYEKNGFTVDEKRRKISLRL